MNELVSRIVGKPWPKGVSGNPSGLPLRPAGSRQTFSAGFLDDLAKTWRDKGRQTMEWTAENQPSTFFAVCARLIGPEVKLTIEQQLPGNLSPADWNLMMQILDAVKSAKRMLLTGPQVRCLSLYLAHLETVRKRLVPRTVRLSRVRRDGHLPNQLGISPIILFPTVERISHA